MATRILAGRYELVEKIGEGGMAVVFKARDRLLNRFVAIKILRPEFTKDAVFIESFRRESQMAAGLVHPNIVNIYDVGKEGNIYYIVMELMEGSPLSEIIKKEGALDPKRAAKITTQVASGLAMAHQNHLIHRDVKPHNIMLTADGTAKITDFGIAKQVTGETLAGDGKKENVMGSVHYFSPEQARGGYVDEKSDIYSLGICLYEMLTGKVPFDGETAVEVAVKHINDPMVPPTELNPDIPQDLEDIVMKATDKLQINRYKSMEDFIMALNFVKFSKPSNLAVHLNEENASGHYAEGDAAGAENAEAGENTEKGSEKEMKKKKRKLPKLNPQRYIAAVLAILLALLLSKPVASLMPEKKAKEPKKKETKISSQELKVPGLDGMTVEDAEKLLAEQGLKLEIGLKIPSNAYGEGEIMSQSPSKDSLVKSGQIIKVNVSSGKQEQTVPKLTGELYYNAKQMIDQYGYRLGTASSQFSEKVAKGVVISQDPAAGTVLEKGGIVSIIYSLGSESEYEEENDPTTGSGIEVRQQSGAGSQDGELITPPPQNQPQNTEAEEDDGFSFLFE